MKVKTTIKEIVKKYVNFQYQFYVQSAIANMNVNSRFYIQKQFCKLWFVPLL